MVCQSLFNSKLVLLVSLLIVNSVYAGSNAVAQEDSNGNKLEVGDLIEFDFHGQKQAKIIEFTGTGWPTVEVEVGGKKRKWFTLRAGYARATLFMARHGANRDALTGELWNLPWASRLVPSWCQNCPGNLETTETAVTVSSSPSCQLVSVGARWCSLEHDS